MPSTRAGASDSMPSTAMPWASFSSRSAAPGQPVGERGGPLAHGVGEQQLAAGRRPQAVLGDLEGALVGDLEPADLLDRVAPELQAQRVLLGGREDVEDAAAHGELAAALDEVGAGVGGRREGLDDLLERARSSPAWSATGRRSPRPLAIGLEHGAHRARRRPTAAPWVPSPASGWARRRSTDRRCPTVSLRGLSRSCGRVSHEGNRPTASAPRLDSSAAWRSSASRPVAVTARTGAPGGGGREPRDDEHGAGAGRCGGDHLRRGDGERLAQARGAGEGERPGRAGRREDGISRSLVAGTDTGRADRARSRAGDVRRPVGPRSRVTHRPSHACVTGWRRGTRRWRRRPGRWSSSRTGSSTSRHHRRPGGRRCCRWPVRVQAAGSVCRTSRPWPAGSSGRCPTACIRTSNRSPTA